eukprot:CAMPEP_0174757056 /NCGR_PEP_ID=MMETSP1094-20130205/107071_1 /TAXON_ID=156173 /ORGANISM="Chrysochromulina brevifilum, Strain UTEX LB 985" /LENGTH=231 /DNA_ID=CAMNT_0015962973 /DNA_START=14 /DNA_END=706 /DNA_ORIENTATION=+
MAPWTAIEEIPAAIRSPAKLQETPASTPIELLTVTLIEELMPLAQDEVAAIRIQAHARGRKSRMESERGKLVAEEKAPPPAPDRGGDGGGSGGSRCRVSPPSNSTAVMPYPQSPGEEKSPPAPPPAPDGGGDGGGRGGFRVRVSPLSKPTAVMPYPQSPGEEKSPSIYTGAQTWRFSRASKLPACAVGTCCSLIAGGVIACALLTRSTELPSPPTSSTFLSLPPSPPPSPP